jgi:hypothetical protein
LTSQAGVGIIKAERDAAASSGEFPAITLEVTVSLWPGDGYFFLYVRQSPMIAQISNPNWNRSLYVTYISLTPFAEASGTMKEVRPRFKGELNRQRLQQRP